MKPFLHNSEEARHREPLKSKHSRENKQCWLRYVRYAITRLQIRTKDAKLTLIFAIIYFAGLVARSAESRNWHQRLRFLKMADKLSDEDKSLFKEAFNSFVKEEGGPIQVEDVGNVLRKMGLTPTLAEIEEHKLEVDPQYMGDISYETMLDLYASVVKSPSSLEDEIAKAFRTLDKDNNGFVDATDLRNIMTTVGEALTEDEVDEMISYMDTNGDGKILYEHFIKDTPADPVE